MSGHEEIDNAMRAIAGDGRNPGNDKARAFMHAIEMITRTCDRWLDTLAMREFVRIFNSSVGSAIDKGVEYNEYAETYLRMRWAMVGVFAGRKAIEEGELMVSATTIRRAMDRVVKEARCAMNGGDDCRNPLVPRWVFCNDYQIVGEGDVLTD